jgi:hypothetical protein
MDQATETNMIQTIYDRIYDIVTTTPGAGKAPVFNPQTTFVQVVPLGLPINPADLANAASPINPNGSLLAAEVFFDLVDAVPALNSSYALSGRRISAIYGDIVNGANTSAVVDPAQLQLYTQAYNYLNQTTTILDFTGHPTTQVTPTPINAIYQANQQTYLTALSAYRTAFNNYDLTDPVQQRQWQANAPVLQNAVTQTWNTWRAQGAPQVEQAQNAIATTINSAIRNVLASDQQLFNQARLQPQVIGGAPWYLAYALPSNWADPSSNVYAAMKVSTNYLNTSASSQFTQYGGGASFSLGFWSIGGSFNHQESSTRSHTGATNVSIDMELCVVEIERPWLDGVIFDMGDWFMGAGFPKGSISTGLLATATVQTMMPLLPTAFIAARNISITANWSTQDQSYIHSVTSGSASVGWGPFQIGGSYYSSSSQATFQSSFQDGVLRIPGIQIIAFINQILPVVPPE